MTRKRAEAFDISSRCVLLALREGVYVGVVRCGSSYSTAPLSHIFGDVIEHFGSKFVAEIEDQQTKRNPQQQYFDADFFSSLQRKKQISY